jgi:hypothetical protein
LVLKPKPSVPIRTHPIFRTFGSLILNVKFIFEDAEDMRASFAEEKIETSIAVTATKYK